MIRIEEIKSNIFLISIFSLIGFFGVDYFVSEHKEQILEEQLNTLQDFIESGNNKQTIDFATNFLIEYDSNSHEAIFIRNYRGAAYFNIGDYESAFDDINFVTEKNGRDSFYLYYTRAKLRELLNSSDTASICYDVTRAINSKGSIISKQNQALNFIDSTDIFDINYLRMLALRVKYCSKSMPLYVRLDKELLSKTSH